MHFVVGVLIAIALLATLTSLTLANLFGDASIFVAVGHTLAILGAAGFAVVGRALGRIDLYQKCLLAR